MPFAFVLPSTSNLSFASCVVSNTHPSLPLTASTQRGVLRSLLKGYRKLPPQAQTSNLPQLSTAVQEYLPYLFCLKAGLLDRLVGNDRVEAIFKTDPAIQWRSTLTQTSPSRPSTRVRSKSVDFEVCFVLTTLAFVYNAQARQQLLSLYSSITPSPEQRTAIITSATKTLLEVAAIHAYLASHCVEIDASSGPVETLSQTQSGLSALALAETTLLAVLKDDPYPAVVAQDRNKNDKDWMIKPPEIPKVRAHLFARLCLAAAEHAGKAEAVFRASGRMDEDLVKYAGNLTKTARARACRFFGIDAELGGETGKGIAWLTGAKKQLGFAGKGDTASKLTGLAKLKRDWTERREDRKVEKGGDWGSDAGRLEELRVVEMLEQKWNKMNDTINTQIVPASEPLIAGLPSGRDIHTVQTFSPPHLDNHALSSMRAPPDTSRLSAAAGDDDSSDEENNDINTFPPGAFPDAASGASHNSSYY